jgi:uncharacterized protein (TIGR03000 family)
MRRQRLFLIGAASVLGVWALAGVCRAGDFEPGVASGFTAGSPYSFRPLTPYWSYYAQPRPGPRYEAFNSPVFMTSINYPGINGAYSSQTAWMPYYDRSPAYSPDAVPAGYLTAAVANLSARIDVRMPSADADLTFDNRPTSPTGLTREFVTPPLRTGANYVYNVRVSWVDDGVRRTRDKNVFVQAGDRIVVDMSSSQGTFEGPSLRVAPNPEAGSSLRTQPRP